MNLYKNADQLSYGISALSLGPAVKSGVTVGFDSPEWGEGASVNSFRRSGGDGLPVTPTEVGILWDEDNIYVLFSCADPDRTQRSDKNESKPFGRNDRVIFVIQTTACSLRDFDSFTVHAGGRAEAIHMEGMTYIGGDEVYSDYIKVENKGRTTALNGYTAEVRCLEAGWKALLAIPWSLAGGRPEESFKLQFYRIRYQSREVLCPFPLDLHMNFEHRFEIDPTVFLEARLGGKPKALTLDKTLSALPSGTLRWQRPSGLFWPASEERKAIWQLQQEAGTASTEETLADRIHLLQRWQDLLVLEGYDFFCHQQESYPWPLHEPWLDRRLINEAFLHGDMETACKITDGLLRFLDTATRWWYADGSPGNILEDKWEMVNRLISVKAHSDYELKLNFEAGDSELVLTLTCPAGGSLHLYGSDKGFFQPERLCRVEFLKHTEEMLLIKGDNITAGITLGSKWEISALDSVSGRALWKLGHGGLRVLRDAGSVVLAVDCRLSLGEKDEIYGFGERFDALGQRGGILSLWQRDSWEGCIASIRNQAYKNIPLLHCSGGYSMFLNTTYRTRADIGHEQRDIMRLTMLGPVLDMYIWPCAPLKALEGYTELTGKPLLPPKWVFEPWAGGGGGRWANGPLKSLLKEMLGVIRRFEQLDIPHSAFYAEGAGPDATLYSEAKAAKLRILSWEYPAMAPEKMRQLMPDTPEEELPLLKITDRRSFGKAPYYIDFTHPDALELLRRQWKPRLDAGVAGTMVDFGDLVPDQAVFHDGRKGDAMHNFYLYDYARSYNRLFSESRGDDFVLFQRGGAPGTQAFASCFGGDHTATFAGLTAAIYGGLNIASCGFPVWGSDIGGYYGFPDEEVYIRWIQFGCFSPIMRFHGTEPREPWEYSKEAVEIYKRYAWIRESLLEYTYSAAVFAHRTGIPVMRPLPMVFPEDENAYSCDDEYMYGGSLLAAPVHSAGSGRQMYFPEGSWTCLWTGEMIQGPSYRIVEAPIDRIPVFLCRGAVVPVHLNESLEWGMSMSRSKAAALIVTPPADEKHVQCWDSACSGPEISLTPCSGGFEISVFGRPETRYILVCGAAGESIGCIMANGREIPELPARQGIYCGHGWYDDGSRVLISLPGSQRLQVRILKD